MKTQSILCTLLLALVAPLAAHAHGGAHGKHVMGTITAVHPNHIVVKTTDGKSVGITLNDKTEYFKKGARGNVAAAAADLKEEVRVAVDVTGEGDGLTGTRVVISHAASHAKQHDNMSDHGKESGAPEKR